jgi:sugar phosphate isomerase/epimerase
VSDPARAISLAHLCMIEVAPVELVRAAAAAGFDTVGLRLVPTADGVDHGVLGHPAALGAISTALDATGVRVLDIEVVRIKPDGPGEVRPLLEAGATLGARHVICTVEDADPGRRVDHFAAFCTLAAEYGLRPNIEYMIFSAVPTLAAAREVVERTGGQASILVDPLHHERAGGHPSDLAGLTPTWLPYVQLCDASPAGPATDPAAARAEAVLGRLLPGEGALPLRELLGALDPATAISVETPLAGMRCPPDPAAFAARALAATRRVLAG